MQIACLMHSVMSRNRNKYSLILHLELIVLSCACILPFLPIFSCLQEETMLSDAYSDADRKFNLPYKYQQDFDYIENLPLKQKKSELTIGPSIMIEKYFQIEPSDAIDSAKYSQPAINPHHFITYPSITVPFFKETRLPASSQHHNGAYFPERVLTHETSEHSSKPNRDIRFLNSMADEQLDSLQSEEMRIKKSSSHVQPIGQNNFTDSVTNLLPVPSDAILNYKNPSIHLDKNVSEDVVLRENNTERVAEDIPSQYLEYPKSMSNLSTFLPDFTTHPSIGFGTHVDIDLINQTDSIETTTISPFIHDEFGNISSSLPSLENGKDKLSSATVAGIVIAVLVSVTILSSAVIYLLYKKYNGKFPNVVEGKFNSDNCGY